MTDTALEVKVGGLPEVGTSNDKPPDVAGRRLTHADGFSGGDFLLPWVSAVPGLSHGGGSIHGLCGRTGLDRAPGALAGRAVCCTSYLASCM